MNLIAQGIKILHQEGPVILLKRFRSYRRVQQRLANTGIRPSPVIANNFTWVTTQELIDAVLKWDIGRDYDVIVGVPRGGLLVASMIAMKWNKPLTTPWLLAQQKAWYGNLISVKHGRVLVIDDSCGSGSSIVNAGKDLAQLHVYKPVHTAVVFCSTEAMGRMDYYYREVTAPAALEWEIPHSQGYAVSHVVMDMDGVICEDFQGGDYYTWLRSAKPLLIPDYRIDIVTNRLSRYEHETRQWLHDHGIRYGKLLMWNVSEHPQYDREAWADFKLAALKQLGTIDLMYESDPVLAAIIAKELGIPVVCMGDKKLYS